MLPTRNYKEPNVLRTDHRFAKIKIEMKQTDKMTENQQHAFVKEYFSPSV